MGIDIESFVKKYREILQNYRPKTDDEKRGINKMLKVLDEGDPVFIDAMLRIASRACKKSNADVSREFVELIEKMKNEFENIFFK